MKAFPILIRGFILCRKKCILKIRFLSPSLWNIKCCGCCYLSRTHRLHPMFVALQGLFLHQWRARPQKYWICLVAGRLKGKPLWNVITLYKPRCKERGKTDASIPNKCSVTYLKILYRKMAQFSWEQTRSNQSISVSVAGTWSADAKHLHKMFVCIKWKGSGFYVGNKLEALSTANNICLLEEKLVINAAIK